MRNTLTAVIFFLLFALSASSQTPKTGTATAAGTCNLANSGPNATNIHINCGIGQEQGKKIIELLNHALGSKDLATINSKLDELIQVASRPATTNTLNCIGSNCVQNGNQTNVDQRQFGSPQPPPQIAGLTIKDLDPIDTSKQGMSMEGPMAANPGLNLSFTVDRIFQNPMFLVLCDRACFATAATVGGAFSPQMLNSPQDPRVAGVALGLMGPLMPGNPVTLNIRSADDQKVTILHVEGYVPPIQR